MPITARTFEYFIASRYLRAKRKQAVISVITVISIAGVAAGVAAATAAAIAADAYVRGGYGYYYGGPAYYGAPTYYGYPGVRYY